jgi:hypothetical protein
MDHKPLYDRDFYAWANEQATLLRSGRLSEADIENIAEEIESLGKREKRELARQLTAILLQMLKWRHQPVLRGNIWRLTLEEQRERLADHLADNPSFKASLGVATTQVYRRAILGAARETGFERTAFPATCPWTSEQILNPDFYPEATN